jgi:hypothetical protein
MPATEQQFALLGLTQNQLNSLLDELDHASAGVPPDQRRSPRTSFRSVNVHVRLLDSMGRPEVSFRVPTRNISLHGLAFLHHHMLPIDQLLHIEIPFKKGYVVQLLARVARCRHVRGMIHEIGVEFKGKLSRQGLSGSDSAETSQVVGDAKEPKAGD